VHVAANLTQARDRLVSWPGVSLLKTAGAHAPIVYGVRWCLGYEIFIARNSRDRRGRETTRRAVRPRAHLALPSLDQVAVPHRYSEAILAPSAWDRNFAQVTVGTTTSIPAIVPNPQSVPAITLSRPTTSA
jgi:hypothetical protein